MSVNRGRLRATPQHPEATEVFVSYIIITSTIVEQLYGQKIKVIKYYLNIFCLIPKIFHFTYFYIYTTILLPCNNWQFLLITSRASYMAEIVSRLKSSDARLKLILKFKLISLVLLVVCPHDSDRQDWEASGQHKAHMYFICWGLCLWHLIVQTQMNVRSRNSSTWIVSALSLNFYMYFFLFYLCILLLKWSSLSPLCAMTTDFTFNVMWGHHVHFLSLICKIIHFCSCFCCYFLRNALKE